MTRTSDSTPSDLGSVDKRTAIGPSEGADLGPAGTTKPSAGSRSASRKMQLQGKNILIVDDYADARELLEFLLTRNGAAVTSAASAEEVLRLLETKTFDVLISDIEMPGMDGFTLIKKIRERETSTARHLPAIALSAHARQTDKDWAAEMGFDSHMSKPFDPDELYERILQVTTAATG